MFPRTEMLDLVVIDGKARGIVTRNLVTGKIESHVGRRGGAGHRRLRQRLLSFDQRQGLELHGHLARAQARRAVRQSLLHADPPHLHSGLGRLSVEADADERIAAQRRPHLGAAEEGRQARRRIRFRKTSAIITWSAAIRASAIWCRAMSPRATPRRSATKAAAWARAGSASTSISRDAIQRLGEARHRGALRQPVRHVRAHHRRRSLQGADAHLSRPSTTRWAGCGWTTT